MNALSRLVDHRDLDVVRAMALAACDALPDTTAVLALADLLAEHDDPREHLARKLAKFVNTPPREVPGVRLRAVKDAIEALPGPVVSLAAWLACRWASPDPDVIRPAAKLAVLVPLGLHRPCRTTAIWPTVDPVDAIHGQGARDLWLAAVDLLDSPNIIDGREGMVRTRALAVCRKAVAAMVGYDTRPFHLAVASAWRQCGGCLELASGLFRGRGRATVKRRDVASV